MEHSAGEMRTVSMPFWIDSGFMINPQSNLLELNRSHWPQAPTGFGASSEAQTCQSYGRPE